jgi:hypothetical protein
MPSVGTCYYSVEAFVIMACPLFLPSSPLTPLSDLYGGECAAEAVVLTFDTLLCCNAGYARDSCRRAAQSDADAFRFLIKANRDGVVDVAWSSERDHHPVAVGTLAVDCRTDTMPAGPLERQARACAAAYFRQVGS